MINQDEIYEMAWDFMKERYEIDLETCEDYYFLDELKILAVHCEFIFAAIGSCENEKILQSVMNSLCRVWESGGSYERTEKEDEFEIESIKTGEKTTVKFDDLSKFFLEIKFDIK